MYAVCQAVLYDVECTCLLWYCWYQLPYRVRVYLPGGWVGGRVVLTVLKNSVQEYRIGGTVARSTPDVQCSNLSHAINVRRLSTYNLCTVHIVLAVYVRRDRHDLKYWGAPKIWMTSLSDPESRWWDKEQFR